MARFWGMCGFFSHEEEGSQELIQEDKIKINARFDGVRKSLSSTSNEGSGSSFPDEMDEAGRAWLGTLKQNGVDILVQTQKLQAQIEKNKEEAEARQKESRRLGEEIKKSSEKITELEQQRKERAVRYSSAMALMFPHVLSSAGSQDTLESFKTLPGFSEQVVYIEKIIEDLDHWYVPGGSCKAKEIEKAAIAAFRCARNNKSAESFTVQNLLEYKVTDTARSLGEALDIHRWGLVDKWRGIEEPNSRKNFPGMR